MNLRVFEADLADARDAQRMLDVLDSYASDPVGGSEPLSQDVRARLPAMLRELPTSLVLVAAVDDTHVGVAIRMACLDALCRDLEAEEDD